MHVEPTVSAVIPTVGRVELRRAVESVLNQTVATLPIVVLDRPAERAAVEHLLAGLSYELVLTRGEGGAGARNAGVSAARSEYVAFLDDDDEWLPDKTALQLEMLSAHPGAVGASRAVLIGSSDRVVPEVLYGGEGSLSTYLLDRSTLRLRRHFMQSSSLMMRTSLAAEHPWRPDLKRHQDWDLLISMDRAGIAVVTHPVPLVRVQQGSVGSVSKSTNWRDSEMWLEEQGDDVSTRSRADFLASVVLRGALASRDWSGACRILFKAVSRRPHAPAVLVGLSGIRR
jgi:glycosyltransferase involved in cell wall biosynthesis